MIGDFKKAFKEPHVADGPIPKGILKAASQSLPGELEYEDIGQGFCIITNKDGLNIRGKAAIDGVSDERMQECTSSNDIMFYARNLQKNLYLGPDEDGYLYVNGQPIDPASFVYQPLGNEQILNGKFIMVPSPFNEELHIPFEFDDSSETVDFERAVHDSISEMKYVSKNFDGLSIIIYLDRKTAQMKITVTVSITKSKSVSNICRNLKYYNNFAQGKVKMSGHVQNENNIAQLKPFDNDTITFWNRVYEIESNLQVNFDVEVGLTKDDLLMTNQLYRSLIQNKPFKSYRTRAVLSGNNDFSDINDYQGKIIMFRYCQKETMVLLGERLDLLCIRYLFDCSVVECTENKVDNTCEFVLESAPDRRMYASTMYINDEETAINIINKEEEYREMFINADEL